MAQDLALKGRGRRLMAVYERREVVTRRIEFLLPRPVNHIEFDKAMQVARAEYAVMYGSQDVYDDVIWVDARDGETVIWFEAKATGGA